MMFCVASLHIIGPGRSVMPPGVVGHVSLYLHKAQTPEKKQRKCVVICTVTNNWRQRRKSHSDAVEITLKKLAPLASIRLRAVIMAAKRKRHPYCDVTTIRQTRYFRFWRRQMSRWRRRWSRQTGEGTGPLLPSSMSALAYFAIKYTHRTTVLLWCNGLCDIRVLFLQVIACGV